MILIQAFNFFIILFISLLHYGTKEEAELFKYYHRYTEPITWLHDQMRATKYGINIIHCFSHPIRADESWNTQCINAAMILEAHNVVAENSYLASGWNWITVSFDSICNMWQWFNDVFGGYEAKWRVQRQNDTFRWKRGVTTRKNRALNWKRGIQRKSWRGVQWK